MSHTEEVVGYKEPIGGGLYNMWRDATPHDPEYPHFCEKHGIDLKDGNGYCAWGERR